VNNIFLINGSQISGVPLHRANFGIAYGDDQGWSGSLDGYFIGYPNGLNRPGYTYFNFNVAKQLTKQLALNFGVINVFNSNVSQWGLIGLAPYKPENQFGTDTSPLQQGSSAEEFGLAPAQAFFSLTEKI
jgi:outer membrane receptor protein involved in Fe transport